MKKIIALLLAMVLTFSLAACGGKTEPETDEAAAPAEETAAPAEETETPAEETEAPAAETETPAEETEAPAEETEAPAEEAAGGSTLVNGRITFDEPIVVVDNEACAVKINGIVPKTSNGYVLKVQITNKTESDKLFFHTTSGAVDGAACRPELARRISAGVDMEDDAFILEDDLAEAIGGKDVSEIKDIEVSFEVETFNGPPETPQVAGEGTVHVYPNGGDSAE